MTHLVQHYGLFVLAAVILVEACGIPVPGETALIAAALLAARGHLSIAAVIIVAAVSAVAGGVLGFLVGRHWGRPLLARWDWLERWSSPAVNATERFFGRHGAKTIFFARFLPVLRVTAAWMAGVGKMSWWRFAIWNAAGSMAWAVAVGLVVYSLGNAAARVIRSYGVYGAIAVGVLVVLGIVALHLWQRRLVA